METPYISVNESHLFVFPVIDFNGKADGEIFASEVLKLPSFGNWWVWGMGATRVSVGGRDEMPSGSPIDLNIFDTALSQFWWTGGSLASDALLPLRLVAGKAGNGGFFSEPKFVTGGTTLAPRIRQRSGATPTDTSLLYVCLYATLADNSKGQMPVVPSLGGYINEKKGEHYKALITADFAARNLPAGSTRQYVIPMNKATSFVIQQLTCDKTYTDTSLMDPLAMDQNILVNVFDTRTTWKWVSPSAVPISLLFGTYAARPFPAPTYFYMDSNQNLSIEITNNTGADLNADTRFVFDGYLNENILGQRVR